MKFLFWATVISGWAWCIYMIHLDRQPDPKPTLQEQIKTLECESMDDPVLRGIIYECHGGFIYHIVDGQLIRF